MDLKTSPRITAPELRVASWIDGDGQPRTPLTLAELAGRYKVILLFRGSVSVVPLQQ